VSTTRPVNLDCVFFLNSIANLFGDIRGTMPRKSELLWQVCGEVIETVYKVGKRERPFWQIIVKIESGYLCLYVRDDRLRLIAEDLQTGELIVASGSLKAHRDRDKAKLPNFLDPVDQLVRVPPERDS
jgi:hypothetical protein